VASMSSACGVVAATSRAQLCNGLRSRSASTWLRATKAAQLLLLASWANPVLAMKSRGQVERRFFGNRSVFQRESDGVIGGSERTHATRLLRVIAACLFGTILVVAPQLVQAQAQSEIQYTYDAAGNVIGVTRTSAPKPDLTVSNLSVGIITAVGNGSFSFPVTFQVNNIGNATAVATWYDRGYLSAMSTLHDSDQVLGGSTAHSTNVAVGGSYTVNTTFTTSTTTTPGTWTLIVKADGGASTSGPYSPTGPNYVDEFNEFNNTQAVAINLPANPKPDLTVSNLAVGTVSVSQNGSYGIPVAFQVNNVGSTTAPAGWYDAGYLSTDAALDNSDVFVGYTYHSVALASAGSYVVNATYATATSTAPGAYTLFVKADGRGFSPTGGTITDNGLVVEVSETNNTQALSINLPTKPDLTVSNASFGAITVNQSGAYVFPVSFTVNNNGGASAQPGWYDAGYLSTNATLDNSDLFVGYTYHSAALAAGSSYVVNATYATATTTAPGTYTLFLKADGRGFSPTGGTITDNGLLVEASETNNTQALSITLPVKPDLAVSNGGVGTITVNQNGSYSFPVSFTVTNNGGATAQPGWYDAGYLSTDATLDNADLFVGYTWHSAALAAAGSYVVNATYTTATTTAPGNYTLFLKSDGRGFSPTGGSITDNGLLAEASETNNTQALSITLPVKPDLTVSNLTVGTIVKNGNGSYSIPVSFQVNNIGGSAAVAGWYDRGYLSADAVLNDTDQVLSGNNYRSTSLAAGNNYVVNLTFTTSTSTTAGTYYLIVKADGGAGTGQYSPTGANYVIEANETNNVASTTIVLP
jgi:YD repeat-containing protein